ELEVLEQRHINREQVGTNQRIPSQISYATQAWTRKPGGIDSVCPLIVTERRWPAVVRAVVAFVVEVEVAASVGAAACVAGDIRCAGAESTPVQAALISPDAVELPTAQGVSQEPVVGLVEPGKFPHVVGNQAMTHVINRVTTVDVMEREVGGKAVSRRRPVT